MRGSVGNWLRDGAWWMMRNRSPSQLTVGLMFGTYIGLLPKDNLLVWMLIGLAIVLRANYMLALAVGSFFSLLGFLADPFFHAVGGYLLELRILQGVWTWIYHQPLLPWLSLHNSVLLGCTFCFLLYCWPAAVVSLRSFQRLHQVIVESEANQVIQRAGLYRARLIRMQRRTSSPVDFNDDFEEKEKPTESIRRPNAYWAAATGDYVRIDNAEDIQLATDKLPSVQYDFAQVGADKCDHDEKVAEESESPWSEVTSHSLGTIEHVSGLIEAALNGTELNKIELNNSERIDTELVETKSAESESVGATPSVGTELGCFQPPETELQHPFDSLPDPSEPPDSSVEPGRLQIGAFISETLIDVVRLRNPGLMTLQKAMDTSPRNLAGLDAMRPTDSMTSENSSLQESSTMQISSNMRSDNHRPTESQRGTTVAVERAQDVQEKNDSAMNAPPAAEGTLRFLLWHLSSLNRDSKS